MNVFEKIFEAFELAKIENNVKNLKKRDFFDNIFWEEKILWLHGLRWVWKTTILFQKLQETKNAIYVSMDWGFLKWISLFEIVKELYKFKKITNFFIDEIHFSNTWIEDLKNIYDLLPVKVVFSWSNKVWLYDKWADLSRRVVFFKIPIFSFREYLNFYYWYNLEKLNFEDIFDLSNYSHFLSKISINHLKEYYRFWQLGIYYSNPKNYELKLNQIIKKMIYEDGVMLWKLDGIANLEKLIYFIANTVQNKISFTSLWKKISVHPKTISNYLELLERVWIFYNIKKYGTITDTLRKEIKPYFTSTNFIYPFCVDFNSTDILWKLRENFFISCLVDFSDKKNIFFKTTTDFVLLYKQKEYEFEIWWKNKKRADNVYVVKDDILVWDKNTIPLWLFGML